MKSTKSLIAASALAAALGSPLSHAAIGDVYSALFQGVTFTFTQTDADTLKFELAGNPPLGVDWVTATFLGAFDLKDIGLDFGTATGTAFGPGTPGFVDAGTPGTGLLGLNSQLSAASQDCLANGSPPGSICFDINPNVALTDPFDYVYTINFSSALNIASTGPHLQIVLTTDDDNGAPKVGSLYSQSVPGTPGTPVPTPDSGSVMLLGLAVLGFSMWTRKRTAMAA
jgi:hypothetical protein